MAGPTYVTSGSRMSDSYYAGGAAAGPKVTLTKPTAAAVGDAIAVLVHGVSSTPNGWANHGMVGSRTLLSHVIQSGEASWEFTGSGLYGLVYFVARGSDADVPVGVVGAGYSGTGTSHAFPGLSTPRANCLAVLLSIGAGGNTYTFSPPAGMTERYDSVVGYPIIFANADELAVAAAGVVAAKTLTTSASASQAGFLFAFQPPPAPTVTSVSPAAGGLDGGTPVTIEGTGFSSDTTVDIGGAAATSVVIVSSTVLTCVTPARTAGAKTVTVTNSAGDGTLAAGFTYTSVVDANVKLVRGGSFVGNDKADTSTQWPGSPSEVEYGGASDLWGTTFTAAQVNASDFGVGIAATVGSGSQARVSYVEMEVAYSVPNVEDPQTYLAVLKVDSDLETAYPAIYRLPRFGFTIANDPSLYKRTSGAELWSSRIYEPARYIEKVWRVFEFGIDITPEASNTVGFQVWAKVDDGSSFQLRDGSGNALTVRASGEYKAFFPASDVARGKYLQLGLVVPDIVGEQVPVEVNLRNMALRFSWRPDRTDAQSMPLDLGEVPSPVRGARNERRSPYQKLVRLMELAGPGKPPVAMRDTLGRDVYAHILGVEYEEVSYKTGVEPHLLAVVSYRVVEYS